MGLGKWDQDCRSRTECDALVDEISITFASILFKILSDCVTSLKKVKSNTTLPYIELLICVPAKPTSDVGTSCQLDLAGCDPTTVPPYCRCSNHFATSLLTNEV